MVLRQTIRRVGPIFKGKGRKLFKSLCLMKEIKRDRHLLIEFLKNSILKDKNQFEESKLKEN